MPTKAEAATETAFDTLVSIMKDAETKPEYRLEAAKLVLNRPRFFIGPDVKEV